MNSDNDNILGSVLKVINSDGMKNIKNILEILINEAMLIDRSNALKAKPYERTDQRTGYANGFKAKTLNTACGKLNLKVPQVRGDIDFYPSALEKGSRSERALLLAIAEMYVKGISTRKVTDVLEQLCGLDISSTQVSRVAALLDEELDKWRNRPLGAYPYLVLDARYEKVRIDATVRSCAVLTAIGISEQGEREILGVSVSLSEAEVHWRAFLSSLVSRGLNSVSYVVSDSHEGLKAAVNAVFNGITWQRCQCHLQRNAQAHVPKKAMAKQVHRDIADVFAAPEMPQALERLNAMVERYNEHTKLSSWLEENIIEGLAVFSLPVEHRTKMRTSNMAERVNEEVKRRTRVARLFPNEESILRLVSAIEMEISEQWLSSERKYLDMSLKNENNDELIQKNGQIYRKTVA